MFASSDHGLRSARSCSDCVACNLPTKADRQGPREFELAPPSPWYMSFQNGHTLVSHEGNKLSTISKLSFFFPSYALYFEQSKVYFYEKTHLVFLCFCLWAYSGYGSVSFFHHKLVKRMTPLLIGRVFSDLHSNWPAKQRGSLCLVSLPHAFCLLAVLQGRVVWHDNFSGKEC